MLGRWWPRGPGPGRKGRGEGPGGQKSNENCGQGLQGEGPFFCPKRQDKKEPISKKETYGGGGGGGKGDQQSHPGIGIRQPRKKRENRHLKERGIERRASLRKLPVVRRVPPGGFDQEKGGFQAVDGEKKRGASLGRCPFSGLLLASKKGGGGIRPPRENFRVGWL